MQVLLLLNFSFVLSSSSAPVLAQRHVQLLDHFSFQEVDRISAAEELHVLPAEGGKKIRRIRFRFGILRK
jgi:hypothetical protein